MLSADEAKALADLEPREVMLSKLAGMMKSEMSRAAATFQAVQSRFLSVLDAYKAKLPQEPSAEVGQEPGDEAASEPTAVTETPVEETTGETALAGPTDEQKEAEASPSQEEEPTNEEE